MSATRTCPLLILLIALSIPAGAQENSDPRAAKPERPTVATHAWTIAPRYVELETGVEWDRNTDSSYTLSTPALVKIGVARRLQLGVQAAANAASHVSLGLGDAAVVLKYRVSDDLPVLGAFAVQPGLKFPTGSGPHGTSTTDGSLLLISSHTVGSVEIDANAGYTRRSGMGIAAPRNATVWTVSAGGPLHGAVGFAAEIFGFPATSGPFGSPSSVACLAGPTVTLRPWAVVDAGAIIRIHGEQPQAAYAGLVYNFGHF